MTNTSPRQSSAESFAVKARLDSMTLRCDRQQHRRIEEAFTRERIDRPRLSLSRFLAECVANGLPENLPPATVGGIDSEHLANQVVERVGARVAGLEAAVPFISDVLADLSQRLIHLDQAILQSCEDSARIRKLIENALGDTNESGDQP
jgi:hypothetical protein